MLRLQERLRFSMGNNEDISDNNNNLECNNPANNCETSMDQENESFENNSVDHNYEENMNQLNFNEDITNQENIDGANDILKNVNHLQPENICVNENEIKSVKNSRSLEMRLRKKIKVLESHLNNETKSKN